MKPSRQPVVARSLGRLWGENIRLRRLMFRMSQRALAEAVGLRQQSIARFESGEQIPLDRTKVQLARALRTTPGELFPWPPMEELVGDAA